jgi:hypothetical protein
MKFASFTDRYCYPGESLSATAAVAQQPLCKKRCLAPLDEILANVGTKQLGKGG